MIIFKITSISIISVILIIILKKEIPQIGVVLSIVTGIVIIMSIMPYLKRMFELLTEIGEKTNVKDSYINITFKVIGISYISSFVTRLCNDCGESAIGQKVEFAGKVLLIVISAPVFLNIIDLIIITLS